MCGICFVLEGIEPSKHVCNFDLYEPYARNQFLQSNEELRAKYLETKVDFIKHLSSNGLFIKETTKENIESAIGPRGPNAMACCTTKLEEKVKMDFWSSLLHLRGDEDHLTIQPLLDESGENILIYNGEIFNCQESKIEFDPFKNDSQQLFQILVNIMRKSTEGHIESTIEQMVCDTLKTFQGDYAFVFYSKKLKKLLIAKDPFGKRSLLFGLTKDGFVVSSCAINAKCESLTKEERGLGDEGGEEEVGLDLKDAESRRIFLENKYAADYKLAVQREWVEIPCNMLISVDLSDPEKVQWDSKTIQTDLYKTPYQWSETTKPIDIAPDKEINIVGEALKESVQIHVQNIFAFKSHFDVHAKEGLKDIGKLEQQDEEIKQDKEESKVSDISVADKELVEKKDSKNVNILRECQSFKYGTKTTDSSIAVLFSGGLDSALITRFLDIILPQNQPIDLLSLSFSEDSSDRKTALSAYNELKSLNPTRNYNLILIDKSIIDLSKNETSLLSLIFPRTTHMDFNIALVLHLASQATGYIYEDSSKQLITSGAKVILSGLGADEIFGGYSRYRVAFQRSGYQDLVQEMNFDLERLWIRNLGRDDRAISQNGREVRFPFLSKNLIETVSTKIDFGYFTNFTLPRGTGDKILLRQVAKSLGLLVTSGFRKKAIQFGTGIAKQSNIRNFGSNRKAKGSFKYAMKDAK